MFCALMRLFVANPGSRITVGFVQLAEMVGHRGMTQQLDHAVLMRARGLDEETPELAPLRIEHPQRESDAHKCLESLEAMILVCFRHILRHALQRLERAAIVFAWLV